MRLVTAAQAAISVNDSSEKSQWFCDAGQTTPFHLESRNTKPASSATFALEGIKLPRRQVLRPADVSAMIAPPFVHWAGRYLIERTCHWLSRRRGRCETRLTRADNCLHASDFHKKKTFELTVREAAE